MIKSSYAQLVKILDCTSIIEKNCLKKYTGKTHTERGSRKKGRHFPQHSVFLSWSQRNPHIPYNNVSIPEDCISRAKV